MVGLSLVPARDDLDLEIRKAEEACAKAYADQRALGRDCSDAEAKAVNAVVTTLTKRLDGLRARRITRNAGLDEVPVAQPGPTRPAHDDELRKVINREASALLREESRALRQYADQVAEKSAQDSSKALRAEIDAVRAESKSSALQMANRLMAQRETREQGQREAERDILQCRREIADLRDALRAAGFIPPPAPRALPNGNNDNA